MFFISICIILFWLYISMDQKQYNLVFPCMESDIHSYEMSIWVLYTMCAYVYICMFMCNSYKPENIYIFFLKNIYLFILDREEGREGNIIVWLPLICPLLGTLPQPRHMPWLGIKPATLWFTGQRSIHWATPARAIFSFRFISRLRLLQ